MADTSFLFGSQPPASISQVTTDTAALPAWLQDYTRGLMGQATQVAGQQYQPYTGARLADLTPQQIQANQQVSAQQGSWKPGLDFAAQTAPQQVGAYMSPYTKNVTDEIARLGTQNLRENLLPQVNSTFTGAGQFGSDRNADFTNRAIRDTGASVLGAQSNALQSGYGQALQAFQNDAARAANVANLGTQLGYQDTGMLSQVGQTGQAQNQQALDLAYQNFQQQQAYPQQNLQFLSNIMRGLPSNMATTAPAANIVQPSQVMSPLQAAAQGFSGMRGILTPAPQYQPQQATR